VVWFTCDLRLHANPALGPATPPWVRRATQPGHNRQICTPNALADSRICEVPSRRSALSAWRHRCRDAHPSRRHDGELVAQSSNALGAVITAIALRSVRLHLWAFYTDSRRMNEDYK
jgi:hypothetical protein